MQSKIAKLSDPIALKFERDGLVATYKKRLTEMETYVNQLESKLKSPLNSENASTALHH